MEESHPVVLNVYDLSQGLARQLSTTLLGTAISGVWHTSIHVYGLEYYYGGGIVKAPLSQSPYGRPVNVVPLGSTQVPKQVFEEYLNEISPRYTAQTYNLLKHNCNNFTNEVAQFLVGKEIPHYILRLPEEVMSSPMAGLILPMIEQMETTLRYGGVPQVPQLAARNYPASFAASTPQQQVRNGSTAAMAATPTTPSTSVPPAVVVANKEASSSTRNEEDKGSAAAALDGAKAKVTEEIAKEFAALMASGSLRASEAAVIALKKVSQRHGINAGVPSSGSQP